ncbi:hypothetical protein [Tichowtungia aerotolerans]|uniref:Uncharacterized protein n=1 Tax=Tichowtungia aerotolerans TaxID=2697043 RepID=A0A6P1M6T2_9BACT|nr:hypothetical protein [Tichowtungia aerotolerans]QHI70290.1 hypothetical protein GT409_12845 [Tichowtungia aerotolerans]
MKRVFGQTLLFLFILGLRGAAVPTFGDLAVLLAKGYFGNAVQPDASLEDCVVFLNRYGIHFSMFDLMDPHALVTKEDFARAVGQSRLLFSGEAVVENGVIKRPNGIDSWVDYCLLNDVDLNELWNRFLLKTERKSVPEVEKFFNGAVRDSSGGMIRKG